MKRVFAKGNRIRALPKAAHARGGEEQVELPTSAARIELGWPAELQIACPAGLAVNALAAGDAKTEFQPYAITLRAVRCPRLAALSTLARRSIHCRLHVSITDLDLTRPNPRNKSTK